jgi:hypothetical protein
MSFRQYGGINYAARNNIVKNNYTNANNLSVMTKVGQPDSIINVDSGLYGLGGDITFKFLDQPFYGIVFSDGTTQTTAKFIDSTNYWQPIPGDTSPTPVIYYSNTVLCGVNPSPSTFPVIGSGVKLATNGNVSLNGKLNVGYISGTTGFSTFSVEGTTGNTSIFGTLGIGTTTPSKKLEVFGDDALINGLTIGRGSGQQNSNTAIGDRALLSNVQDNFFLSNGASNTAVGSISLYTNTEGSSNTAVGVQSLFYNLTGSSNTAVGLQSLYYNSTGFNNTAFGNLSLFNSRGSNNTGQGLAAGYTNTSGSNNTYIGYQADCSGNNFSNSTALGANAKVTKSNQIVLGGNNSGYPDVYVPGNVGIGTTTPSKKLDVAGSDALINGLTIGFGGGNVSNNTTLGVSALSLNTTGVGNSAIGFQSLRDNGVGQWNTALGYSSSRNNTSGSDNTALGFNALLSNYTGSSNTAVGRGALESNSTNDNTAVGYYSLKLNTTGTYNVAVGYHTLSINTTGYSNTAIGFNSLRNTTGDKNTGIGYSSLINTTGQQNTSIGYDSGKTNVSGNNNTFLGFGADCSGNNLSNSTAIGYNAKVTTNNQIVLGGNNGGYPVVYVPGTLTVSGATTLSSSLNVDGETTMLNKLSMGSTTAIANRQISSTYYNFYASNNISSLTYSGRLYGNLNSIVYDCPDANSSGTSSHIFYCYNGATPVNALQLNYASSSMSVPLTITTNNPASAISSLTVIDSSTTNQLVIIPNVGNSYNPATDVGNILLLGKSNLKNTEKVQISTWSDTNNYVKVRPESVGMGAGGNANTATTSVECNGTTVRITPSITFPDNSVQTTAYTGGGGSVTTTVYTTGSTITISSSVKKMDFILIGGGGGGGSNNSQNNPTSGAGGGGCTFTYVNNGSSFNITLTVGAGGQGDISIGDGFPGSNSTISFSGVTVIANGGGGGKSNNTNSTGGSYSNALSGINGTSGTTTVVGTQLLSYNFYGKGGLRDLSGTGGSAGNGGVIIVTTYS